MLAGGPGDAAGAGAPPRRALLLPVVLGVGVLPGLVGIGGGFLVVGGVVLYGNRDAFIGPRARAITVSTSSSPAAPVPSTSTRSNAMTVVAR